MKLGQRCFFWFSTCYLFFSFLFFGHLFWVEENFDAKKKKIQPRTINSDCSSWETPFIIQSHRQAPSRNSHGIFLNVLSVQLMFWSVSDTVVESAVLEQLLFFPGNFLLSFLWFRVIIINKQKWPFKKLFLTLRMGCEGDRCHFHADYKKCTGLGSNIQEIQYLFSEGE